MIHILNSILDAKKLNGLSWKDLSQNLPVSHNALRIAFDRKSVKSKYLNVLCNQLGIPQPNREPNNSVFNDESLIANYLSVLFVNKHGYDFYYQNVKNGANQFNLPTINWFSGGIYADLGKLLSIEVMDDRMDNDSFNSLVQHDLLLLQQMDVNELITQASKSPNKNFVIIHKNPQYGISPCTIQLSSDDVHYNRIVFRNKKYPSLPVVLSEIIECYQVIRLVRNSVL